MLCFLMNLINGALFRTWDVQKSGVDHIGWKKSAAPSGSARTTGYNGGQMMSTLWSFNIAIEHGHRNN